MITERLDIIRVIKERISIVDKSFEGSKDEKWIHIGLVLRGLYEEITGDKYDDVKGGLDE